MYRCKDCKLEYAERPDYCDCGNDSFDEISTQQKVLHANEQANVPAEQAINQTNESTAPKSTSMDKQPKIKTNFDSVDKLSISIFVLCLILSVFAWIFIGKENPNAKEIKKTSEQSQVQFDDDKEEIPDLDTFWNNQTPTEKVKVNETPTENSADEENATDEIEKKNAADETIEKIIAPTEKPSVNKTKKITQTTAPKINSTPNDKVVNQKKVAKPSNISSNSNEAVNQYKASLRQALVSKMAFTSIQGAGNCEVEFSIDQSGKLLNRRFSKLSDNKSLNDAVYNALMSVPEYYPPPSSYGGEKIRLNFTFDNGYYEVSY